jgi:hypothetical protein
VSDTIEIPLYENMLEEWLAEDQARINAHSQWMAQVIINLPRDPAFGKLGSSVKEEILQIIAAIE